MGLYDRYVLPHLINCACGTRPIQRQRQKIVPQARGVVLEVGFGSGRNLPYFNADHIEKVYALEPEAGMLALSRKAAANAPVPVEIVPTTLEAMSLPPNSVDTLLLTYVVCTIPDAVSALRAARRVLKPDAVALFAEHGAAPDAEVRRQQARIEPIWKRLAGGCHLTRDIPAILREGGFQIEQMDTMYLPNTPRIAGFNYFGSARPI